jgi:hypothetical protein
MKKITSTLSLLIVICVGQAFAQQKKAESENPNVTFCNAVKDNDTLKYADLVKCGELTQPYYKELKIKSFVMSVNENGAFKDIVNEGGKLSKENMDFIKSLEAKHINKLIIEDVKVLEANGTERKMRGITINLK